VCCTLQKDSLGTLEDGEDVRYDETVAGLDCEERDNGGLAGHGHGSKKSKKLRVEFS